MLSDKHPKLKNAFNKIGIYAGKAADYAAKLISAIQEKYSATLEDLEKRGLYSWDEQRLCKELKRTDNMYEKMAIQSRLQEVQNDDKADD